MSNSVLTASWFAVDGGLAAIGDQVTEDSWGGGDE